MNKGETSSAEKSATKRGCKYLSLRELASRWNVSISQASRLVIKHNLVRLPVSIGGEGRNPGIWIKLRSIREYEQMKEFR